MKEVIRLGVGRTHVSFRINLVDEFVKERGLLSVFAMNENNIEKTVLEFKDNLIRLGMLKWPYHFVSNICDGLEIFLDICSLCVRILRY